MAAKKQPSGKHRRKVKPHEIVTREDGKSAIKTRCAPKEAWLDHKRIIQLCRSGATFRTMAKAMGVPVQTVYERVHRVPELKAEWDKAYGEFIGDLLAAMRGRAIDDTSDTMLIWLSKNHLGFTDRQETTHKGDPDNPIMLKASDMSDDELAARIAEQRRLLGEGEE